MFRYHLIIAFSMVYLLAYSQFDGQNIYIPEETQSPKEADMVKGFEGFPSIPFLANNLDGEEVNIFELRGQTLILYFWDSNVKNSLKHLETLNKIQSAKPHSIVSFSNDTKAKAIEAAKSIQDRSFHIIANSLTLAEGPYGSELGFP